MVDGKAAHTERAYRADVDPFFAVATPHTTFTLGDVQAIADWAGAQFQGTHALEAVKPCSGSVSDAPVRLRRPSSTDTRRGGPPALTPASCLCWDSMCMR